MHGTSSMGKNKMSNIWPRDSRLLGISSTVTDRNRSGTILNSLGSVLERLNILPGNRFWDCDHISNWIIKFGEDKDV